MFFSLACLCITFFFSLACLCITFFFSLACLCITLFLFNWLLCSSTKRSILQRERERERTSERERGRERERDWIVRALFYTHKHTQVMETGAQLYIVDVDESPDLTTLYGASQLPLFVFLKRGKKTDLLVGAQNTALRQKVLKLAAA
jgi:hypothetical protein